MKNSVKPGKVVLDFFAQRELKKQRKPNEIDNALISSALRGFYNEWSRKVEAHPGFFTRFLEEITKCA